jgi:anti-anti-sigma factor
VVLPHLEEGRRRGDHLLLIGASRPPLVQALASLPERDEMLARGQLEVRGDRDPLAHLSGRGPWLSLHGEVDVTQADCVLRALLDIAREAPGEVVLDLAGLEFLDIAGARMLATAAHLLAEVGVQLRMVRARRLVGRCLELFDVAESPAVSA